MKYNDILVKVACAVHARMVAYREAANPHRLTQRGRGVHPGIVGVGSDCLRVLGKQSRTCTLKNFDPPTTPF